MPDYRIEFSASARRDLKGLSKTVASRIALAIEGLRLDPRPPGCKKLRAGADTYRIRIGSHRVLYEVRDRCLLVLVVKVGDRKDVYG